MQFRVERNTFAELRQTLVNDCNQHSNTFDSDEPFSSLAKFLSSSNAVQSYRDIANRDKEPVFSVHSDRISAINRLSNAGLFQPIDLLLLNGKTDTSDSKFEIPDRTPQPSSFADGLASTGAKYLLKWLPDLFAEGTWPMQISREACLVMVQRGLYANDVLSDLAREPAASPLRDSSLAGLLSVMKHPGAKHFAARAMESLEPDAFDRDLKLLLSGPAGKWFQAVMKGVGVN